MKLILGMLGIAALLFGVSGCVNAKLAESKPGAVEHGWEKMLRDNYSGWQPPQIAPPGIRDNMSPDYVPADGETPAGAPAATVGAEPDPAVGGMPAAVPDRAPGEPVPPPAPVVEEVVVIGPAPVAPPEAAGAPAAEPKFEEYVVQKNDSISGIAKKFYKDGRKYWRIVKANDALKGNPNRIYPGLKLRIPMD